MIRSPRAVLKERAGTLNHRLIGQSVKVLRAHDLARSEHPRLDKNKQIYVLPVKALEEYYPDRWKNLGLGKLVWAERVAKEITKDEFEKKMSVVYNAINQCWDRAYINNQVNPIPSSSAPPCS